MMKKNQRRGAAIIFICFLSLFIFSLSTDKSGHPPGGDSLPKDLSTHTSIFFDKETFYEGLSIVDIDYQSIDIDYHVSGGIMPHHLLPGFILTDFFSRLSVQNPKTIILIGPNHYEKGNGKILSSTYGWKTPFGVLEPNAVIIDELVNKKIVAIDEHVLPNDHAVAGMMPYVKYHIPNAQVVPMLLSGYMTQKDARILADVLKGYMNRDTVLLAPVDFSHYLNNQEAQEKDKITLEVLKNFDYRQLFTLDNDYLDSPASVATLLMVMREMGTVNMDVLYNTNSGEMQSDDSIETTSYFSIIYY